MLLPLKRIMKGRISKKDAMCFVYIQYCHSSQKRTCLNTRIKIPPQYWDKETGYIMKTLPSSFGNYEELNEMLRIMFRNAEDIVIFIKKYKKPNPIAFIKEVFTPDFTPDTLKKYEPQNISSSETRNLDIYYQIDDYIDSKRPFVTPGMINIYMNMKEHLKQFESYKNGLSNSPQKPLTFESLNYQFYEDLIYFLSCIKVNEKYKKQKINGIRLNTIGKTIKQLRTFLRDRMRKNIIAQIDLSDWKIPQEEIDSIYLSESEIEKITKLNLDDHPHLVEYWEEIIIGCSTGLRHSDFSKIEEYDIREGFLHIKQQKSRHWVVIPLKENVKWILERRFSRMASANTIQELNRHGRKILSMTGIQCPVKHSYRKGNTIITEVKPKYEWFSSHTLRRSFCTNEFIAGTPMALIMKISGHKSEKDFLKYIRITPEESAKILLQIWNARAGQKSDKRVIELAPIYSLV